jgi:hypothetical protein
MSRFKIYSSLATTRPVVVLPGGKTKIATFDNPGKYPSPSYHHAISSYRHSAKYNE